MENMDKGLTVPKWVLINPPKIPQMPQNLSAQAQKFGILIKKGASLGVRSPWIHSCVVQLCIVYTVTLGKTWDKSKIINILEFTDISKFVGTFHII